MIICSVLLPSRGRVEGFLKAVDSFQRNSKNDPRLEILARFDDDDPELERYKSACAFFSRVRYFVGQRYRGYDDLHLWFTELDDRARGRWVQFWNDDCTFEGPDYLDQLECLDNDGWIAKTEFNQLNREKYSTPDYIPFPIAPRGWYRRFGFPVWIPPADFGLTDLLIKHHDWKQHVLKGCTVNHQRRSDDELLEHRKIK